MEKHKTAVEWLVDEIENIPFQCPEVTDYYNDVIALFDQAKQMEKEQNKQDVYNVCKLILSNPFEKSGKTPTELFDSYYESKYGKDENTQV